MVELDELAGRGGAHAGEEAPGVAAGEVAPLPGPRPSAEERAGAYVSEHDALPEDPADGGLGAALGAESVVHLDPAEPAIRPRCGRYAPFAWADSRPIPRRDQSVFPWLREIHMCLN